MIAVSVLVICLPAGLVLATVASWRAAVGVGIAGALLTKAGSLGLGLGMRLFPRDNLLGGFGPVFGTTFVLGGFALAVGLTAIGSKALAAVLPEQWLSFAGPTAERLRARFGGAGGLGASLVTQATPVLLAGYLLVATAVSVGSLFVADFRDTWRAGGGMGVWFVAGIAATSIIGPLAILQLFGRHPGRRWLALVLAANWGLYNLCRCVEATGPGGTPESLLGSLIFAAFSAFGLVLAAVAPAPVSGSRK